MKHILKLQVEVEFDHSQDNMTSAIKSVNFDKARDLAYATRSMGQGSKIIEAVMFANQENFQTRILALYMAGVLRGSMGPPTLSIEIIHKKPPEE